MSDYAIRVDGLVKEYEVYAKPIDLAIEVLTRRKRHTIFRALDGVSFDVMRGEVLGIIGSNGAGKSTLLKIITGVLDASGGSVDISGRVTAILELGLGFNPEYSGRENIYLSSLLYGMNKEEIDRKIDDIIAFSGLREFIERPVKTYSSGMHSRLAFSIATAVDPDILIIDEALAAGDAAFVQKCLRRIRQLCSGGRTVLLVSHGTGLLAQLCQRVIWMEKGQVRMVGSAIQVVQAYDLAAHQNADAESWIETVEDDLAPVAAKSKAEAVSAPSPTLEPGAAPSSGGQLGTDKPAAAGEDVGASARAAMAMAAAGRTPVFGGMQDSETGRQVFRRGPVFIENVELFNSHGDNTARLTLLEPFTLKIHYRVEGELPTVTLGVALAINNKHDLGPVAQFITQNIRPFETRETYINAPDRAPPKRQGTMTLAFDHVPFRKGEYLMSVGLLPNEPATWEFYEYRHFYYPFSVDDAGMDIGAPILLNPKIRYEAAASPTPPKPRTDGGKSNNTTLRGETEITTLREEIEAICMGEGYPHGWPRHHACSACGQGPLVDAFEKYGFMHARCGNCGFVCLNPYPPNAVLGQLYSGKYYSAIREHFERPLLENGGAGTPYSAPPEVLTEIINRVTAGKTEGAWLDVGGGLGAFASLVRKRRPKWQVTLNESNPQSVAIAREIFALDILPDDPALLAESGQRFDVITSVSVLEHIPQPLSFLESYAALLLPDGWLVTVIPHFTHLNAAVSRGSSGNVVPPFHVSLFNEGALRTLLGQIEGLEIVAVEQAGPAAFHLIEHMDYGDMWDVTIPTAEQPSPQSVRTTPYSDDLAERLNALEQADTHMGDYFADSDGRLYLIAYCRKRG